MPRRLSDLFPNELEIRRVNNGESQYARDDEESQDARDEELQRARTDEEMRRAILRYQQEANMVIDDETQPELIMENTDDSQSATFITIDPSTPLHVENEDNESSETVDTAYQCAICGADISLRTAVRSVDGRTLCRRHSIACAVCGDVYGTDSYIMIRTVSGEFACDHCTFECSCCNRIESRNRSYYATMNSRFPSSLGGFRNERVRRRICSSCHEDTVRCAVCRDRFFHRNTFTTPENRGRRYCRECFNQTHIECNGDHCENLIHPDFAHRVSVDFDLELYFCDECYAERMANICRFNFKPVPKFQGKSSINLFFGLELEVENTLNLYSNEEFAGELRDAFNWLYCKHDGSLRNGFEIVTEPMSWSWYRKNKRDLNVILRLLEQKGYTSYNLGTCGIHIHMSKQAFTTFHLYKVLQFFHINMDYMYMISQRTRESSRGDCQWSPRKDEPPMYNKMKAKCKAGGGRYIGINLTNRHTIEFRIFRGTLNRISFHKNFEFLNSLYHFTKNAKPDYLTYKDFNEFVLKNKKTNRNLINYLVKRCSSVPRFSRFNPLKKGRGVPFKEVEERRAV